MGVPGAGVPGAELWQRPLTHTSDPQQGHAPPSRLQQIVGPLPEAAHDPEQQVSSVTLQLVPNGTHGLGVGAGVGVGVGVGAGWKLLSKLQ